MAQHGAHWRRKKVEAGMDRSSGFQSAKIYAFPARGRVSPTGPVVEVDRAGKLKSARVTVSECGAAWYHDAAIQDALPSRKR